MLFVATIPPPRHDRPPGLVVTRTVVEELHFLAAVIARTHWYYSKVKEAKMTTHQGSSPFWMRDQPPNRKVTSPPISMEKGGAAFTSKEEHRRFLWDHVTLPLMMSFHQQMTIQYLLWKLRKASVLLLCSSSPEVVSRVLLRLMLRETLYTVRLFQNTTPPHKQLQQ
jgi:hypothetical protein